MSTAFIGGKIHHSAQDSIIMSICYIDFALKFQMYTTSVVGKKENFDSMKMLDSHQYNT
jgi:hypothetical protein